MVTGSVTNVKKKNDAKRHLRGDDFHAVDKMFLKKWMAFMRRIVRREVRQRGFFGWLVKGSFILFNLTMLFWLFNYFVRIGDIAPGRDNAGAEIGAVIGTGMILGVWALGAIVLGIATALSRGEIITIEETG